MMKLNFSKIEKYVQKAFDFITFIFCDTISFGVAAFFLAGLKRWVYYLFPSTAGVNERFIFFNISENNAIFLIQFVGSIVVLSTYAIRLAIHCVKMIHFEIKNGNHS